MLMRAMTLKRVWGLNPAVIVHVGACRAEEEALYTRVGWGGKRIVWVEANRDLAEDLSARFRGDSTVEVINALAWDTSGQKVVFRVTNNLESSSALGMKEHHSVYPTIRVIEERTLESTALADVDSLRLLPKIDLLVLDIQGAELRALQGLRELIARVDAVYAEVNTREMYENVPLFGSMKAWLAGRGFALVDSHMTRKGWGDALWLRARQVPIGRTPRRLIRQSCDRAWTALDRGKRIVTIATGTRSSAS